MKTMRWRTIRCALLPAGANGAQHAVRPRMGAGANVAQRAAGRMTSDGAKTVYASRRGSIEEGYTMRQGNLARLCGLAQLLLMAAVPVAADEFYYPAAAGQWETRAPESVG